MTVDSIIPLYVTHPYHMLKNGCLTDTKNDCRKREERESKSKEKVSEGIWDGGSRKVKLQETLCRLGLG